MGKLTGGGSAMLLKLHKLTWINPYPLGSMRCGLAELTRDSAPALVACNQLRSMDKCCLETCEEKDIHKIKSVVSIWNCNNTDQALTLDKNNKCHEEHPELSGAFLVNPLEVGVIQIKILMCHEAMSHLGAGEALKRCPMPNKPPEAGGALVLSLDTKDEEIIALPEEEIQLAESSFLDQEESSYLDIGDSTIFTGSSFLEMHLQTGKAQKVELDAPTMKKHLAGANIEILSKEERKTLDILQHQAWSPTVLTSKKVLMARNMVLHKEHVEVFHEKATKKMGPAAGIPGQFPMMMTSWF